MALTKEDLQAIADLMDVKIGASEQRLKAYIESHVEKEIRQIADGHKMLYEKMEREFGLSLIHISNVPVLDAVPHLEIVLHITVIFGIGVHETGFLYRFNKRNSLRYRSTGKHFGQNMFACVKTFNCVQRCV